MPNPQPKPKYDDGGCPTCGSELEMGFGLAGGGYGPYNYCPKCEQVIEKTQEDPEA